MLPVKVSTPFLIFVSVSYKQHTRFFYKKNFYQKMILENPQKLKKMLRKSAASNA